ncbi:hypothetical protein S140_133 [Shewanella sp. phage 1/40]|uniref:hypothetical protein n=1 Tax=Shewanella sp. phage 1/40 TaxID=1458860 RepID=UPI0004F5FA38|nr:hypothetical protein S140_133 [Shewanella sp. phage 1/40]AHK11540.1 hypothetical protein S140_133 [Shewanella sp. phage 1/40]
MSLEKMECGVNYTTETIRTNINGLIDQNVSGIKSLESLGLYDGMNVNVNGFYVGTTVGGGNFVYDISKDKADHNGGTIIAPEAIVAWDGSAVNIATLLDWTGTGVGCFVRPEGVEKYNVESFGGLRSPELCTASMQKLLDTYGVMVGVSGVEYTIRRVFFNRPVYVDLNRCTIRGDVFTTSGFRADEIDGIYVKNGHFVHTKTAGVYVQALTLWDCQNITLEDLTIDGFSQFSINITHTINGEYSGFRLDRVKVTNGGNFFSDPSNIANCLEFFSSNSSAIRTDTLIKDCEFSLMPDARGNIAKLGLCRDTKVIRSKFSSLRATFVGSSGIQSGSNNNPLNGENKVTMQDCEINCIDTTDGYHAYDGTGEQTLIRTNITGNGGSIYAPPKGAQVQKWTFIDSNIADVFLYDNPINQIEKLSVIRSFIKSIMLEKGASIVSSDPCVVQEVYFENATMDQVNFRCTLPSIKITGPNTYINSILLGVSQMDVGKLEVSGRAELGDIRYTDAVGNVDIIVLSDAVLNKISLRQNNLKNLLVKNSECRIKTNQEWFLNGSESCRFVGNTIQENFDLPTTTATNVLMFYNDATVSGNAITSVPNRTYYITADNCNVRASNNVYEKSNNTAYTNIGAGEVRNFNCLINDTMLPFTFSSLPNSIAEKPIAFGQLALASGAWYQSVGTVSVADWKRITNV